MSFDMTKHNHHNDIYDTSNNISSLTSAVLSFQQL